MLVRRTLLILFCGIFVNVAAQNIPSAMEELKKAKNDTARFNALLKLGVIYQNVNPDSALLFHLQAKEIAVKTADTVHIIKLFSEIIWDYYIKNDYENAVKSYNEVQLFYINALKRTADKDVQKKIKRYQAACISNIASVYVSRAEYMQGLEYYFMALEIAKEQKNKEAIASHLANIGTIYNYQGDLKKALEFAFRALKSFEETGNKSYQAGCLGNIGLVYSALGNHKKALEYHMKSYNLNLAQDNKNGICDNLQNIGIEYALLEDQSKAIEYFLKALKKYEELGNRLGVSQTLGNLGDAYHQLGYFQSKKGQHSLSVASYNMALENCLTALKINKEIGNIQGECNNYVNIGDIYLSLKKISLAENNIQHSYKIASAIGSLNDIKNAHLHFYELYNLSDKPVLALKHYKLFIQFRDSVFNLETTRASIQHEVKFIYEKKATADSVKTAEERKVTQAKLNENEAKLKQEKTQRYALYGGLLLVITFAIFIFNRFQVISTQKKVIEVKRKEAEYQKQLVEEKQNEILDSIRYAKRIQTAMLTNEKYINRIMKKLNPDREAEDT